MQEYEVDDYEINDSFFDGYKPKKLISDVKKMMINSNASIGLFWIIWN